MSVLSPEQFLRIWEHGHRRRDLDRALLMLAFADTGTPLDQLAHVPLGRRNHALMELRRACFGDHMQTWADCPSCGERMEFEFDTRQLPSPVPSSENRDHGLIEIAGLHFHRLTSHHLAQIADMKDPGEAARRLLTACALSPEQLPQDEQSLDQLMEQVTTATETADPWADLSIADLCPACGQNIEVALDIPALLWEELSSHAYRVFDEVHTLAAAYGWSEHQILDLGDLRRAAYLQRVRL